MNSISNATDVKFTKALTVSSTTSSDWQVMMLAEGLAFPEGPAFASDGNLWAVELKGGALVQWKDGQFIRHHVGGAPNGIAIDSENSVWFCDADQNAIRCFDPSTNDIKVMADKVDGQTLDKPNDLAFDSKGNLVFTCPGKSKEEPTGYVCVLTNEGNVKKITAGKYFPNGLAFTANGKSLVIAETYKHRLWKGDWNADTCEWTNENVWCNIGGPIGAGGPDGMAFDAEGNLYAAIFGTGNIKVVNKKGEVINEILLIGQHPTNCAFDPSGKLGLVVSEAQQGVLVSINVCAKGQPLFKSIKSKN